MWFIGVEVAKETSAPPPKKNPGSAPANILTISFFFVNSIEITSWKARAYGIFTRVCEVSEIERVSAANK